ILNHKLILLGITVLLLGGTGYIARDLQTEFIPREDQGLFQINLTLPEGSRVELSDLIAQRAKEIVETVGGSEVVHIYARVGVDPSRVSGSGDPTGPNRATLSVALSPDRTRSVSELVNALDPVLSNMPEIEVKYQLHETALEGVMGGQEAPIQVEVSGENLDILSRITDDLQSRIESLPSIYNVRTSFQGGQPEVDLAIRDEVAAAFGLTTQTISRMLERQLTGEVAGELSKDQRTRDIRVKYQDVDLRELQAMRVEGANGAILTLGDIADLNIIEGPREILRENQRRVGRITGYLSEGSILSEAIDDVRSTLETMVVPTGYRVTIGGEERERAESFESLKFALILSIVLVYMVMASLFESTLHPFTVMFSVPLAGIGVVVGFWILAEPLSVMAYIGIIMLGGIAVN
ncbi:MAG: efflux RND transporter permease subunit, partial [Candidatus Latescibacteria bacterium]|nr:efflux RND transporter permease subunit [Candidatus Latescibacterota bacterium]